MYNHEFKMDTKRKDQNFLNLFASISFKLKSSSWPNMNHYAHTNFKIPEKRIDFGYLKSYVK